jgi:hypothetical protein
MFDDVSFSRSELYFNVQQLCRVFSQCIEDTISNLHKHYHSFMKDEKSARFPKSAIHRKALYDAVSLKWPALIESRESKLRDVLNRLDRKRAEVESLQDGVRS